MITEVPAAILFRYIVDDFQVAWNALVERDEGNGGGGNFLFALLATVLVEFAWRLCGNDQARCTRFRGALGAIEPLYLSRVRGQWNGSGNFKACWRDDEFLTMIFDAVRNGKAHQYQSPVIRLKCDCRLDVDVTGPRRGRELRNRSWRPTDYLHYKVSAAGDVSILLRPDQLFLDIKNAIEASGLLEDGSSLTRMIYERDCTASEFVISLEQAGFTRGNW